MWETHYPEVVKETRSIEELLKWQVITFNDENGNEIKLGSEKHVEYIKKMHSEIEDYFAREMVKLDVINTMKKIGVVDNTKIAIAPIKEEVYLEKVQTEYKPVVQEIPPVVEVEPVLVKQGTNSFNYNVNTSYSNAEKVPRNKELLNSTQLTSAISFYNNKKENNTWREILWNAIQDKWISLSDFNDESLAKWFAEVQKQNWKTWNQIDWKAWEKDISLLWLTESIYTEIQLDVIKEHKNTYTIDTSADNPYKNDNTDFWMNMNSLYNNTSVEQDPVWAVINIPDWTKLINANEAQISQLEVERADLKNQMEQIKNQIDSQSRNWSNTGIIIGGQHYWNSYSGWASLEQNYNSLVRQYNSKWDELDRLNWL